MKSKVSIFALLFVVLILTPLVLNIYYNFLRKPVSQTQTSQIFVVKPGQPVVQIAKNLQNAGLIKNGLAFRLYVAQTGIAKTIQAGDFRLSPNLSSREIARELTHGAIDIWVTFPEGTRVEEMADMIDNKLNSGDNDKYQFDKKTFIQLSQEGRMFPDTYLIARDATAVDIATRLKNTFDEKVDRKILLKGAKSNLTEEDVIILASIIEREANSNEERPIIAGIILNRISALIPLQVDATVQYAKGYDSAKNTWWPKVTTNDYRSVKSLYNTYLHLGLPPKPIANPGIQSIKAAAEPADTPFMFYLHDVEGKIHYAKTADEHDKNIQKYL